MVLFGIDVSVQPAHEPGLLFYLSGERALKADYAEGASEPNFANDVKVIPGGAKGAALECGHTQLLSYRAPGNIYAQRGTLSFFWRSREPVGPTPFPIFRVGYADHSSWDMVWLRIDYNGQRGFDAFVTDASLARTRVSIASAGISRRRTAGRTSSWPGTRRAGFASSSTASWPHRWKARRSSTRHSINSDRTRASSAPTRCRAPTTSCAEATSTSCASTTACCRTTTSRRSRRGSRPARSLRWSERSAQRPGATSGNTDSAGIAPATLRRSSTRRRWRFVKSKFRTPTISSAGGGRGQTGFAKPRGPASTTDRGCPDATTTFSCPIGTPTRLAARPSPSRCRTSRGIRLRFPERRRES